MRVCVGAMAVMVCVLLVGCTGDADAVSCADFADHFAGQLREATFDALETDDGEIDIDGIELRDESSVDCGDGEFQMLLADRVVALFEEVGRSPEFQEADDLIKRNVGNTLAIFSLALNDDLPTPEPS